MTDTSASLPPAGWHPDSQEPGQERWWDGFAWTEHVRQSPSPAPPEPAKPAEWWESIVPADDIATSSAAGSGPQPSGWATAAGSKKPRRGFLDSPFERRGSPQNVPGNTSLALGLLAVVLKGFSAVFIIFALFALIAVITGVVFGFIGMAQARREGRTSGTAVAGTVVTIFVLGSMVTSVIAGFTAAIAPLDVPGIETHVEQTLLEETGVSATVECPPDPPSAEGSTFNCVATMTGGGQWNVGVTVTDGAGSFSWQILE